MVSDLPPNPLVRLWGVEEVTAGEGRLGTRRSALGQRDQKPGEWVSAWVDIHASLRSTVSGVLESQSP